MSQKASIRSQAYRSLPLTSTSSSRFSARSSQVQTDDISWLAAAVPSCSPHKRKILAQILEASGSGIKGKYDNPTNLLQREKSLK